jgi:hypothetical protein
MVIKMSKFTAPLDVRKVLEPVKKKLLWLIPYNAEKQYWITLNAFDYVIDDTWSIHVPEGYKTDFASVPRPLWSLFPPDGVYTQAAVLHDYIYGKRGKGLGREGKDLSRSECDKIFLRAMETLGVDLPTRRLIYRGVRLGGWLFF